MACVSVLEKLRLVKYRVLTATTGEVIGYAGRAVSAAQTGERTLGPYIVQSVLPLVAPALFAASIYMELGRIVEVVEGDANLFIRRRFLTAIFVCGDVLSFFMQGAGKIWHKLRKCYWTYRLTHYIRWWIDGIQDGLFPKARHHRNRNRPRRTDCVLRCLRARRNHFPLANAQDSDFSLTRDWLAEAYDSSLLDQLAHSRSVHLPFN